MEEKILIIFETNKAVDKETINDAMGLKFKYCNITTLEDIYASKIKMTDYIGIIDCTFKKIIFNHQIASKKGVKYTENNIEYIKTSTNRFVVCGPTITQLSATLYSNNQSVLEKYKKDMEEYKSLIKFLIYKIPELRSKSNFNKAITQNIGINLNEVVQNNRIGITYKLVKEIPETKEQGVEYITFDNIFILNELKKIIDTIR